jgi:hypothetical protein
MTHFTIKRQQERERRERLERQRVERERLDWAELSARAERQRVGNMLLAQQVWNYSTNLQRLFAVSRDLNGD